MRRLVSATLFLMLLICSLAGAGTKYVIKDLGVLPGDDESHAYAINSKGQIVGTSYSDKRREEDTSRIARTFIWQNGSMTEITLPEKTDNTRQMDLNDRGQILFGTFGKEYVYENGKFITLPMLPGSKWIQSCAMNSRGDVVGFCWNRKGCYKPFLWRNGIMEALPLPEPCFMVHDICINDSGLVAAHIAPDHDDCPTVIWQDGVPIPAKGDLGRVVVVGIGAEGILSDSAREDFRATLPASDERTALSGFFSGQRTTSQALPSVLTGQAWSRGLAPRYVSTAPGISIVRSSGIGMESCTTWALLAATRARSMT